MLLLLFVVSPRLFLHLGLLLSSLFSLCSVAVLLLLHRLTGGRLTPTSLGVCVCSPALLFRRAFYYVSADPSSIPKLQALRLYLHSGSRALLGTRSSMIATNNACSGTKKGVQ